jgi:hypothetical protein
MSEDQKIIAYKGFDENWQCRGFQYEIGKTYKHEGEVKACKSGFHACLNPLDVLNYYDVTSNFAIVELSGETSTHEGDSKIASAEITIKAELKLPDFIDTVVSYLQNLISGETASGNTSRLAASGNWSQLAASGDYSQLAASGNSSQLAASGNTSRLAASGYYSQLAASGNSSQLAASGNTSRLAASGNWSQLAASGNCSQLAASGNWSQLAASGDYSQLAASGYYSQLAASGNSSQLAASGNASRLAASGDASVVVSAGLRAKAKCGKNGAIALAWWSAAEDRYRISTAYEGENGIKADTWYQLDYNGNFVEVNY